ncbi:hypothetical protein ACFVX9_39460, partial [Kitasatospora sp. NPDC058243]
MTAHDSGGASSQPAVVDFRVDSGGTGGPGGDTGSFTVSPAAGYPQYLAAGGAPGYPAVQLVNTGQASVSARDVTVTLPAGKDLEFVHETGTGKYALTAMPAEPWTQQYPATLAPGGQSLTARGVDLALPSPGSHSALWCTIAAPEGAPPGDTALEYAVGSVSSPSAPVHVTASSGAGQGSFAAFPAPGTDVYMIRGSGLLKYPGIRVRNTGGVPVAPQTVTVTLPAGLAPHLSFVAQGPGGAYELSVEAGFGREIASAAGQLSPDRQMLTFTGVDLAVPEPGSVSALWVPVTADATCPLDVTALLYTVGNEPCLSTPVHITDGLTPAPGTSPGDRGSFQASPAGPPDVTLTPGGPPGHPAVRLLSTGHDPVTPRNVTTALPPNRNLAFAPKEGTSDQYEITVITTEPQTYTHPATLAPDRQSLTTTAPIDLHLPAHASVSAVWADISAQAAATAGETACAFTVGDQNSSSTPILITASGGSGGGGSTISQA